MLVLSWWHFVTRDRISKQQQQQRQHQRQKHQQQRQATITAKAAATTAAAAKGDSLEARSLIATKQLQPKTFRLEGVQKQERGISVTEVPENKNFAQKLDPPPKKLYSSLKFFISNSSGPITALQNYRYPLKTRLLR